MNRQYSYHPQPNEYTGGYQRSWNMNEWDESEALRWQMKSAEEINSYIINIKNCMVRERAKQFPNVDLLDKLDRRKKGLKQVLKKKSTLSKERREYLLYGKGGKPQTGSPSGVKRARDSTTEQAGCSTVSPPMRSVTTNYLSSSGTPYSMEKPQVDLSLYNVGPPVKKARPLTHSQEKAATFYDKITEEQKQANDVWPLEKIHD